MTRSRITLAALAPAAAWAVYHWPAILIVAAALAALAMSILGGWISLATLLGEHPQTNARLDDLLGGDQSGDDLMALADTLHDTPALPRQRATGGAR